MGPTPTFETDFTLGNEAFDSPEKRRGEIARLLRELADKVEAGATGGIVSDVNGNRIGNWGFDPVVEDLDDVGIEPAAPEEDEHGFVERMETRPTDMRRSIHRSHRGEGRNFVD